LQILLLFTNALTGMLLCMTVPEDNNPLATRTLAFNRFARRHCDAAKGLSDHFRR
jgi:hypothetical protein